jgi:hypothetical protein
LRRQGTDFFSRQRRHSSSTRNARFLRQTHNATSIV